MGLNFYTSHGKHIGKRSAAGIWCWDCNTQAERVHIYSCISCATGLIPNLNRFSLICPSCKLEQDQMRVVSKPLNPIEGVSVDLRYSCPICKKNKIPEEISYNPVMRELGFDQSVPIRKTGINGASSFTWQIGTTGIGETPEEIKKKIKKKRYVYDEMRRKYSSEAFTWLVMNDVLPENVSDHNFT